MKARCAIVNVQLQGRCNGKNWTTIYDHSDKSREIVSKTYGFNSDLISGKARYIRLNVQSATLQNNPTNNWYNPTVYEVKIYGEPLGETEHRIRSAAFDFEQVQDKTVPDITGNGNDLTLYGNTAVGEGKQEFSFPHYQ